MFSVTVSCAFRFYKIGPQNLSAEAVPHRTPLNDFVFIEDSPDDSSTIPFSWRQRRTTPPRFRFPGGNAARLLHDFIFLEATPHDSSTIPFSWRYRRTTPQ